MNDIAPRKIKTGNDPRMLADYAALRDELAKLSHPARPDVNWRYAEKLCLSLFEQNGVELQTAAWYTLARTHRAGLSGLNEGLAILEALISHHWSTLWPQPVNVRIKILTTLSYRIQQVMRTLPLSYSDLSQLYHAEQQFTLIESALQRMELKHLSQFDTLRSQIHNNIARVENSDGALASAAAIQPAIVTPPQAVDDRETTVDISGVPVTEKTWLSGTEKYVQRSQQEHQPDREAITAAVNSWRSFFAGMSTMLVVSAATVWGWSVLHRPDPLQSQLAASLAPLPAVLTPAQLAVLRQQSYSSQPFITDTRQQLARLGKLPPDWNIDYGRQLAEQAQALWPEQAKLLMLEWQQQLTAADLPVEALSGWHQGMEKLQQLSDRLNRLDEQRGKYITVSELKSVVFSAMQSFSQAVPAEEQLRALSLIPAAQALPVAAKAQIEMHLKQLIARYALLRQAGVQTPMKQQEIPDK
ncbi:VasL domain-containing protein [Erwinia sp. MMLR14_017]|uniref:VasL domain-containing protein n=1 Tax=Erwinia sp. MMLR14_017 TaxID=3093842 RepID=UPI00298FF39F|nr:VasL domain-containing protein [Erwinia sp. MMLR14_017]MDW8846798.1 VasL domain-containing protein [Erwinia sp. MMLR14_017]